jgi:LmbE family N-acetylglucosaminyl deacetylase
MKWIYLSPHLDDAVYSCGGLIHQQVRQGNCVEIWTIFAGQFRANKLSPFAEDIHQRWGTGLQSVSARRMEDELACAHLGASEYHFDFQDVIYRNKSHQDEMEVVGEKDLFRNYQVEDEALKESIRETLQATLEDQEEYQFCVPLSLGNHIDHQIVRHAADAVHSMFPKLYYADFPYVVRSQAEIPSANRKQFALFEEDVDAWCEAIALYASQISTFWTEKKEIREEIYPYWQKGGGSCLWFLNSDTIKVI